MEIDAIDQAVEVLNRLHLADPTVMQTLVYQRVPCNQAVAEDPTIQVGGAVNAPMVGILGIINGLFGVNDQSLGYIVANIDGKGKILNFSRLVDNGNS